MGSLQRGRGKVKRTILNRKTKWYVITFYLAFLTAASFSFLLPLIYMVTTAFKEATQVAAYPPRWIPNPWSLRSFVEVWQTGMYLGFARNTIIITAVNVFGVLISCTLVAFGFAVLNARTKPFLFALLLSTMMIPSTVTLIPMFQLYAKIGWVDTYLPLTITAYMGGGAFNIFLLRQFFSAIPRSLTESARLDGCNWLQVCFSIFIPNAKPALLVITIFSFVNCWNDYFGPLIYLTTPAKYTLAIGINLFKNQYGGVMDAGPMMAMATLSVLPVLILYMLCQKYFVQGVVTTGMKM